MPGDVMPLASKALSELSPRSIAHGEGFPSRRLRRLRPHAFVQSVNMLGFSFERFAQFFSFCRRLVHDGAPIHDVDEATR